MTTYLCPKCKKRNLHKNGWRVDPRTRKRSQIWACRSPGDGTGVNKQYCYSTVHPESPYARDQVGRNKKGEKPRRKFKRKIDTDRIMIFTAAQNATPVHKDFFATLKVFAEDWDA